MSDENKIELEKEEIDEVNNTEEDGYMENEEKEDKNDDDIADNPYDRMVKSLTNRASNKRKIKLMENQLAHFVFAESDSEDDEDYTVADEDINSDEESDCDDVVRNDDGSCHSSSDNGDDKSYNLLDLLRSYECGGGGGNESASEASLSEIGQDEADEKNDCDKNYNIQEEEVCDDVQSPVQSTEEVICVQRDDLIRSNRQYKKTLLVCGVCLESEENEGDEIVECDNCGITVHEGCYGDFNLDYDNKSVSDDLTEPWFCEPCKAGITNDLICELCPTIGGIFKETDTGKWVHLICALYTPYVGFRDVVKLQIVVLEDIKCHMWGKKECSFCLDNNFAKTGVCISCDAGLCKTMFHVTCGQRNGFLSDIPDKGEKNDEMTDFLFAHCKLHTMKMKLKKRKISWLAFKGRVSKFKQRDDAEEKERIASTLGLVKQEYKTFRRLLIPPKQLPQEFARYLSSCPEACMMLARKAEMMDMVMEPSYNINAAVVSGRILKHEANLSEDFVNYFFKREMRMKELQHSINHGEPNLSKLQNEQNMLMKRSEGYHSKLEKVQLLKASLTSCCQNLHDTLCKFSGRSLKLPSLLKHKHNILMNEKIVQSAQLLNSIFNRCDICESTDDQHLLAHCGTCSKYYHMNCVDPPLTRLPRKSDKYVWQCTSCDPSDISESDTEGPICITVTDENGVVRRKRPNKEPEKYNSEKPKEKKEKICIESSSRKDVEKEKRRKEKKKNKRKCMNEDEAKARKRKYIKCKEENRLEGDVTKDKENGKVKSKEKNIKESIEKDVDTKGNDKGNDKGKDKENIQKKKVVAKLLQQRLSDCFVCKKSGDQKSLVKCDECGKCYHFLTCINPPYPRNPKVNKYWAWICEECDNTDEQPLPGIVKGTE